MKMILSITIPIVLSPASTIYAQNLNIDFGSSPEYSFSKETQEAVDNNSEIMPANDEAVP